MIAGIGAPCVLWLRCRHRGLLASEPGKESDDWITLADLTGVPSRWQIANCVLAAIGA
ncbi:hypothetical protein GTA26_26095 [Rhodococcus hoagii]|nr:hypothetical protein [Prescottella equi]